MGRPNAAASQAKTALNAAFLHGLASPMVLITQEPSMRLRLPINRLCLGVHHGRPQTDVGLLEPTGQLVHDRLDALPGPNHRSRGEHAQRVEKLCRGRQRSVKENAGEKRLQNSRMKPSVKPSLGDSIVVPSVGPS